MDVILKYPHLIFPQWNNPSVESHINLLKNSKKKKKNSKISTEKWQLEYSVPLQGKLVAPNAGLARISSSPPVCFPPDPQPLPREPMGVFSSTMPALLCPTSSSWFLPFQCVMLCCLGPSLWTALWETMQHHGPGRDGEAEQGSWVEWRKESRGGTHSVGGEKNFPRGHVSRVAYGQNELQEFSAQISVQGKTWASLS